MEKIRNMLQNNPSLEELIEGLDMVRKNGDIVVVKFDGEREENFYTLFITYSISKNKSMIRLDHSNLYKAMLELLTIYINN